MKRKQDSVEQIVAALKQAELGMPGGGSDPATENLRAEVLPLEEGVCGLGIGSGPRTEATSGREFGSKSWLQSSAWTRRSCRMPPQ
jgi:hypothetical protein